jgi:hypothetical protein
MENNNITIEEVKKIANEKRKKTNNADLAQKRLENLAKGREIRKQKLMEAKVPVPVPEPISTPVPVPVPEPISTPVPEPIQRKPKQIKRQNSIEDNNISYNILKETIINLKDEIINAVKPKPKPKKIKTPKERVVNKTLDLTISDAEISNIINPNKKKENELNKGDEKLASFLKALQKN